jgi:anti-anti-sigma factor
MAGLESAPLEVTVDTAGDGPVIKVVGELDASNVATLSTVVDYHVEKHPRVLSFDLAGLSFIDTSGIASLISARNAVGAVRILHPSPAVRSIIELTGLADILVMEP